jgi:hypothetical protein
MVEQVNVFLENKPGRLKKITGLLKDAGVNIRSVEIQDRNDFGVMKLLVDAPKKAQKALADAGLAAALKPVLAIRVDDRPGGLYRVCEFLEGKGVNVLDAYGFVIESARRAVLCLEVQDPAAVDALLASEGLERLTAADIASL